MPMFLSENVSLFGLGKLDSMGLNAQVQLQEEMGLHRSDSSMTGLPPLVVGKTVGSWLVGSGIGGSVSRFVFVGTLVTDFLGVKGEGPTGLKGASQVVRATTRAASAISMPSHSSGRFIAFLVFNAS